MRAVLVQVLLGGVGQVTLQQWEAYQRALMLLLLLPLVMAPIRESILETLLHPLHRHDPCMVCSDPLCLGNRIEKRKGGEMYYLRQGHHKTDRAVGVLMVPLPLGLVALLRLWGHASTRYAGRKPGTDTLFHDFRTGKPFTQQGLSHLIVSTLGFILGQAGLPKLDARGARHLFATNFSNFASKEGPSNELLRQVQKKASGLIGTSLDKFKVCMQ